MQILSSKFPQLVDLFKSAKKLIVISSPGISEVVAEALIRSQNDDGIEVKVYLEITEKSFRNGFGEISAITKLRENNIEYLTIEELNLYFIIIDDTGFFYFPKSLFVEEEGAAANLFPMTKLQVKTIKLLYGILDKADVEYESIVENVGIETLREVSKKINEFDEEQSIKLEDKIKKDPPVKPDYERKLEVYRAKFQFVELKFSGANLHVTKVKLPSKALPFKDDTLKKAVEANLRILDDISKKDFLKPFFDLKDYIDYIRGSFLYYIKKREKNIIKREGKYEFEKLLNSIKEDINVIKKDILNQLQQEILATQDRISKNLFDFLMDNPPKELIGLEGIVKENAVRKATDKIMASINFPLANKLLNGLKLEWHYYDITWQDLNDKEVLEEMQKHGLIKDKDKSYFDELAIGATDIK
jgi:hypothetical protein